MIEELQSTNLFHGIDISFLAKIAQFCTQIELEDGDPLIAENDEANRDMFIVLSGQVEVLSSGTNNTSGEIVLSDQNKEIYGEIAWITGASRTATIRSNGASVAIKINGVPFFAFLETHPELGYQVMKNLATLLAQRMIQTNSLLKQLLWNMQL